MLPRRPKFPGNEAENTKRDGDPGGAVHSNSAPSLPADAAMTSAANLRHGVEPAPAPGLATQQPFAPEKRAAPEAMLLDRLKEILRARGRKPAAGVRASKAGENGRKRELISADENANEEAH